MNILMNIALGLATASMAYMLLGIFSVLRFAPRLKAKATPKSRPAISIFKPIYGLDYGLKENLTSFMKQDYPEFQVVFGVQRADDPAIPVIRQVLAENPDVDAELVIDEKRHGENLKVGNIINISEKAKHGILAISDSDMRVEPDYLDRLALAFDGGKVGLVTCLYKGKPAPGTASRLGAMFINEWFLPSALIPATFGPQKHCFGATMAVTRDALQKIGGFQALVTNLADDYMLGRLVREAGYDIRLAPVVVENIVQEESLSGLYQHELRWARTIKAVEPLGFLSTFLTDLLPWSILAGGLVLIQTGAAGLAIMPVAAALIIRLALQATVGISVKVKGGGSFFLIPVRDFLSFFTRVMCYTGRKVKWRDAEMAVDEGGQLSNSGEADKTIRLDRQ